MKRFFVFLLTICSCCLIASVFCACQGIKSKESFTVTFTADGGTLISGDEVQTVKSGRAIKEPRYAKTGYEFDGWDVDIDSLTESTTVTAKWKLRSYTVLYKLNGGVVDGENPTSYNITSPSFTLINPTKEGSNFLGWKGVNDMRPVQTVTINEGSYGDRTFEAVWEGKIYTLSFNANGGQGEMQSVSVKYGETITLPTVTFAKTDYVLDGWAESPDGEVLYADCGQYVGGIGNKELFAIYKGVVSDYSIKHYLENGQGGYDLFETENLSGNAFTVVQAVPKIYDHYALDRAIGVKSGTISPNGTLVLSLYYNRETVVTFNANGGTGRMLDLVLTSQSQSHALNKNSFTKEGYDFMGWAETPNGIVKYQDREVFDGVQDTTLYAVWSNGTVNVSFDLSDGNVGGVEEIEAVTVTYGGKLTSLATPSKEGFLFIGWFNGKEKVDLNTTLNYGESIVLKALFEQDFSVRIVLSCDVIGRLVADGPMVRETVQCEYNGSTETIETQVGYGEKLDFDFSKLRITSDYSSDFSLKGLYCYTTGTAVQITADTVFDSDTFGEFRTLEIKVSCKTSYTPIYS